MHLNNQMLLGRKLKAADNLMQLCIHGGNIKYGDFKEVCVCVCCVCVCV